MELHDAVKVVSKLIRHRLPGSDAAKAIETIGKAAHQLADAKAENATLKEQIEQLKKPK